MDEYVSLALDVEEKGTEMLAVLNNIRNTYHARRAKAILLDLMSTANRALEARCQPNGLEPFAGLDDGGEQGTLDKSGCVRCRHGENTGCCIAPCVSL